MGVKKVLVLILGIVFLWGVTSFADMGQIKVYKEAYPDAKPKCTNCHVDVIPKKDAGKHELNAYGKEIKKADPKPTATTYKKVGKAEDFKAPKAK